jgi:tetratricopeptide (TPR) repeat protein
MRTSYAWLLLRCDPPLLDEADAVLERAHEVLSGLALQRNLARCETEMARSALLRGDRARAVSLAEQAIARCPEPGPAELQSHVVRGLALVLGGDTETGTAAVRDAAARYSELGSKREAAETYRELAEALLQRDLPEQAIAALRSAADCAGARPSSIRPAAAVRSSVAAG